MFVLASRRFWAALLGAARAAASSSFNIQPFTIDLSNRVPHMLQLIHQTHLPAIIQPHRVPAGIKLSTLRSLHNEWLTQFDWETEQEKLNKFNHFTVEIENLTIHFIHEKSKSPNAIPLILNHGWPGTFVEFVPVIQALTETSKDSSGEPVSFDVVVPSLPGFAFSSAPPENWTIDDTARVFNKLMTDVLGYPKYATHGTDWGSSVAYGQYANFNDSVRAAHFTFLPFLPPSPENLTTENISLSPLGEFEEQGSVNFSARASAYALEHITEPNTIGLALHDNPVGQLSWTGWKIIQASDPSAGTEPSVLNHSEILHIVSLFYLTESFISSIYIYFDNSKGLFAPTYAKASTDAPMLFSAFKYNAAFWPSAVVARVGNLVSYRNHDRGGHFAGLDNPAALIEDLREIGKYWK